MTAIQTKSLIRAQLTIPTLPAVVQRIASLLEDPKTGVREIGAVVAQDAPLAAKVLKIANSAYYGLRERCLSTQHATAVLGVRVLRNVVTQAAVIGQYEHLAGGEFDIDEIWRHSIMMGQACHFVARRCTAAIGLTPDEFYMCGLLHDLGKVVMLDSLENAYLAVLRNAHANDIPLFVAETRELGFNHTDVGHLIATRWGLPGAIANAIQFHHGPREAVERDPVVSLVANTNLLVARVAAGNLVAAAAAIDPPTAMFLGLHADDITGLVEFVDQSSSTIEV